MGNGDSVSSAEVAVEGGEGAMGRTRVVAAIVWLG